MKKILIKYKLRCEIFSLNNGFMRQKMFYDCFMHFNISGLLFLLLKNSVHFNYLVCIMNYVSFMNIAAQFTLTPLTNKCLFTVNCTKHRCLFGKVPFWF